MEQKNNGQNHEKKKVKIGNLIIPVEVKAGNSGALNKSLHQFMHQRKINLAVRFDLNPPSCQEIAHTIVTAEGSAEVKFSLISLSLYAVEQLTRIVDEQQISPRPDRGTRRCRRSP